MQSIKIIFFGSTTDSVIVLSRLFQLKIVNCKLKIVSVVTQPPRPVGRKQQLTPTPVAIWADAHHIPVLSFPSSPSHPSRFDDEQAVIDTLQPFKADLLISASFGQRIPIQAIQSAQLGGLNVHPSLLPRWRGADPVPWAIMAGDAQTGVTIVTLSENFDQGTVIAQKKIPITEKDFSDPLRTKLFEIGTELLTEALPTYLSSRSASWRSGDLMLKQQEIASSKTPRNDNAKYARRLTRDDGFEPWENLQKALENPSEARRIDRKFRALTPWPGIWTEVSVRQRVNASAQKKRLKIISLHRRTSGNDAMMPCLILETVQLEGKKPTPWTQFQTVYLR